MSIPSGDAAVRDEVLGGPHGALPVRIYTPATPNGVGFVWAHGGGFAGGDLDMPEADWVARQLAGRGVVVVSVDYRLAPLSADWAAATGQAARGGVHYPVASNEVEFAFRWAAASGLASGPWALGGASAGANLATGAALRLAHTGDLVPALVVLAYPTLHAVQPEPSAQLRALLDADRTADRFGPAAVLGMYENYLGGPVEGAEVYAIPGLATAEQLRGFAATLIVNSESDELRVSGEAFADALRSAGVEVTAVTEAETQHGHLNLPDSPAASLSIDRIAAGLASMASVAPSAPDEPSTPPSQHAVGSHTS